MDSIVHVLIATFSNALLVAVQINLTLRISKTDLELLTHPFLASVAARCWPGDLAGPRQSEAIRNAHARAGLVIEAAVYFRTLFLGTLKFHVHKDRLYSTRT